MGATRRAKLVFLGLALVQHALVIAAIYGARDEFPGIAFYTAGQLPTLALLLFGRPSAPDEDRSIIQLGRLLLFSAAIGGFGVLQSPIGQDGNLAGAIVGSVFLGAISGGGLAVLFHVLFAVADRWRRGAHLSHALDAWAALAIYPMCAGAYLQGTLPQGPELYTACARGLLSVGALVGLGVMGVELWWRREIGRALAGRLPGLRLTDGSERVEATTPDWSLTGSTGRRALVTDAQTESYRAHGGGETVAWVPTETPASWRLLLLPVLIVVGLCWW